MPIILVTSIFIQTSVHTILILTGCFLIAVPFLHPVLNKLTLCAIIGLTRGYFIENMQENYSYKRTSFCAKIIDVEIKEHGIYLQLENFKYKPYQNKGSQGEEYKIDEYKIDDCPILPKTGRMRIAKIESKEPIETEESKKQNTDQESNKKRKANDFDLKAFKKIESKLTPGTDIIAIGRFMLETPSPIPYVFHQKKPSGVIDKFEIINEEKATFKTKLRKQYSHYLSKNSAQLAKAILLGDTFAIDSGMRKTFQDAGISHLLGVSVLNIAIIGLLFYFIIRKFIGFFAPQIGLFVPLNVISQIGAIIITFEYCYLVGFEYPLLRSLLMSSFSLIALYFGRKRNKEILLWSAAIILLANPKAIYDLGFELSFGAILGICCSPKISLTKLKIQRKNKFITKAYNGLINSIYSTFFASSIIIPISLYQFHTTAIQPFAANIIAIPFVTLIITPFSLIASVTAFFNLHFFTAPFMNCLDIALIIFHKIAIFFSPFGMNIHIDPIKNYGALLFILSLILFSIFNKGYIFLAAGISAFAISIITRDKPPILLIHPYAIGLVLRDKIVVYPKYNFISDIWETAYARKCVNGKNLLIDESKSSQFKAQASKYYFIKEKCSKIVVLGKYGLFFQEPRCACEIPTKQNFIIPYSQQLKQLNIIKLNEFEN